MDDAGRAEDGQAADDTQPWVPGLLGELLAARNRDLDLDITSPAELGDHLAHHLRAAPG